MSTCPCCTEVLLRHAHYNRVYWFCTHCWQEMPDLSLEAAESPHDLTQPGLLERLDLSIS